MTEESPGVEGPITRTRDPANFRKLPKDDVRSPSVVQDALEKIARNLEEEVLTACSFNHKTPRPVIEDTWKAIHEVGNELSDENLSFDASTFLEEFLCLYNRLGLVEAVPKLASVGLVDIKAAELQRLQFHYETLTSPSVSDLLQLRRKVSSTDIRLVPSSALVDLIKLQAFCHHPVTRSLIHSSSCEESPLSKNDVEWPKKSTMKSIKLPLDSSIRNVLLHDMRAQSLSISMLYRLRVLQPYSTTCPITSKVLNGFVEKNDTQLKESQEMSLLEGINSQFRAKLFSQVS